MTRRLAGWMVAFAALCSLGCGGDVGAGDGSGSVELGTGMLEFEPLADGDTIYVVRGPQGGLHFVGSLRARGLVSGDPDDLASPDNPTTEFRALRDGQRIDIGAALYHQGLEDAGDGASEMIGRLVILDLTDDTALDGVEVRLEVELTDVAGDRAGDGRTLIARPHPQNP